MFHVMHEARKKLLYRIRDNRKENGNCYSMLGTEFVCKGSGLDYWVKGGSEERLQATGRYQDPGVFLYWHGRTYCPSGASEVFVLRSACLSQDAGIASRSLRGYTGVPEC